MNILTSVVLGAVEGLTEFLPISSTGHLIIFNQWFAFDESFTKLFDVVIQSGAILAVIVFFWKDVWPVRWHHLKSPGFSLRDALTKAPEGKDRSLENKNEPAKSWMQTWLPVLVAFVPTAIIGAVLGSKAQALLFTMPVVAATLIFYGVIFLLIERRLKSSRTHAANQEERFKSVTYRDALIVGCAQALALVPGTSRSGATILALLLLGYARPAAAKFSFLLAIPTLIAASAYTLLKYHAPITADQIGELLIGFAITFVTAYAVSRWFMSYISRRTFVPFAWYRIALGLLIVFWTVI